MHAPRTTLILSCTDWNGHELRRQRITRELAEGGDRACRTEAAELVKKWTEKYGRVYIFRNWIAYDTEHETTLPVEPAPAPVAEPRFEIVDHRTGQVIASHASFDKARKDFRRRFEVIDDLNGAPDSRYANHYYSQLPEAEHHSIRVERVLRPAVAVTALFLAAGAILLNASIGVC